eukprot:3790385-Rhodomonas_salina.1
MVNNAGTEECEDENTNSLDGCSAGFWTEFWRRQCSEQQLGRGGQEEDTERGTTRRGLGALQ